MLAAIFAPWLGLPIPYQGSMIRRLRPIGTPGYPLGTDELGRDMLSRLIYGGRLTLYIGLLPVVLAFVIGTSLGVIAGYVGGFVNQAIMRTIDVFYAFPSVLLAIAISGALGAGIFNSLRVADHRVHSADRARGRERHDQRAHSRFRRCRARIRERDR